MDSVYIAGPLTGSTKEEQEQKIERAVKAAAGFYDMGYAVFCPHSQTSQGKYTRYINYDGWMANDIYWLEKCDKVAFLPDWRESKGASIEHMVAKGLGKEIIYLTEEFIEQED